MAETKDPKGEFSRTQSVRYVPEKWDENQSGVPSTVSRTEGPGLRYVAVDVVTLNDGTVEYWVKNSDGTPVRKIGEGPKNETRAKAWEKEETTATSQQGIAERADQTAASKTITKVNPDDQKVHIYRFNPDTEDYDIDLGLAGTAAQNAPGASRTPEAAEREGQQKVERERNQAKYGYPMDDIELRDWLDSKEREKDAKDERTRAFERQKQIDIESKAQTEFNNKLALGTFEQNKLTAGRTANKPIEVNGKFYRPVYADDGVTVLNFEEVPGVEPTKGTDFGTIRLEAGNITSTMLDAFSKANARRIRGEITAEQMKEELDPIFQTGNTRINEINGIISTQRGIYQDESANYRQQLTSGTNLLGNAFSPSRQERGSLVGGEARLAELAIGAKYLDMFAPRPQLGAGAEQAKGMGLQTIEFDTNTGKLTIGAGPGSPPTSGPPPMDNPLAMGMANQATQQQARDMTFDQIKDDPFFEPVLGELMGGKSDFAAAEGMSTTDQLRAPGYRAPVTEPELAGI